MVSEIGLGGHYDGPEHQQKGSKEQWQRDAVYRACLKHGINFLDTNAEYERKTLASTLRNHPGRREDVVVVTDINDRKETASETFDYFLEKIDEQLANLGLSYVEILRFTCVVKGTPPERLEAAIKAFTEIKRMGKAKYFAVSQHDPELLLDWINAYDEIDIIYVPYNYFASRAEEELFPTALRKDIGVVAIKPFNKGTIFNPKVLDYMQFGPGSRSVLERAEAEGSERSISSLMRVGGLSLAQASLRYILDNPAVCAVVPGMELPDEVGENAQASLRSELASVEQDLLASLPALGAPLPERYRWLGEWGYPSITSPTC
jgi:aryl-alcohol dehydrogenase-like predicted oxidoreductase